MRTHFFVWGLCLLAGLSLALPPPAAAAVPVPLCHRYRDASTGAWRFVLIGVDPAYVQVHVRHGDRASVSDGAGGLTCGGVA